MGVANTIVYETNNKRSRFEIVLFEINIEIY